MTDRLDGTGVESPAPTNAPGPIALVGSGEFLDVSDPIDRALLDGRPQRAVIIPTAAGLEGDRSVQRWIDLGVRHYRRLGVEPVPVPAIDRASADDATLAAQIKGAGLIYFSGGDPAHVVTTMRDSAVWSAVIDAWQNGTALAGCSAGAMMMGSVTASPRAAGLLDGLGLFDGLCVIPHFDRMDRFRPGMAATVLEQVPADTTTIGIDENTALVVRPATDTTSTVVLGQQKVWSLGPGERRSWIDQEPTDLALTPTHVTGRVASPTKEA